MQNQIIRNNTSKSLPFIRDVLFERGVQPDLHFKDELLVCDQDEAPDYKWRNPDGISVISLRFLYDTLPNLPILAVRRICTLNSDLSMIPTSCFEKKTNAAGDTYLVVVYYLKMFIEGEVSRFHLFGIFLMHMIFRC